MSDMSLRDELASQLETTDAPVTDAVVPAEPVAEVAAPVETAAEARARDESGRFTKKEAVEQPAEPVTPAAPVEAQANPEQVPGEPPKEQQVDLPPSTFTPAAKAAYLSLPADSPLRGELKRREADYQKGINQYRQAAESGGKLMAELQPYMPMIQAEGSTPEKAVKSLLNTAYQLRTLDPVSKGQLIVQMAQQYGADLRPFMGQPAEAQPAPDQSIVPVLQQYLQPLTQQVQEIKTQFMTEKQRRDAESDAVASAQLQAFQFATDEKGQPKHAYYADVKSLMGHVIESGHAKSLEQAYEMACRAHPEVSKALAAEQSQRFEAQRLAEARRKAQEAQTARAVNATGQGGIGIAGTTSSSLRSELESLYDQGQGARL